MYSLQKIKKYWFVNKWILNFLYGLIFSLWILNISSLPIIVRVIIFFTNLLLIKGLMFISDWLVTKLYRPNIYLRNNMRLIDVIDTYWGRRGEIYDKEDDYYKRKEFEIGLRSIWLTYLLTLIVISLINFLIIILMGSNRYFLIDWRVAIAIFFSASAYLVLLIFIEEWEFEKVRFGKINAKRMIIDYILPIIILLAMSFMLFVDKSSLETIVSIIGNLL